MNRLRRPECHSSPDYYPSSSPEELRDRAARKIGRPFFDAPVAFTRFDGPKPKRSIACNLGDRNPFDPTGLKLCKNRECCRKSLRKPPGRDYNRNAWPHG